MPFSISSAKISIIFESNNIASRFIFAGYHFVNLIKNIRFFAHPIHFAMNNSEHP